MPLSPFNVFLLIVVLACSTTSNAEYVIHEERSQWLGQATVRHRVKPDTIIPIRIALKQKENGMAKAEEWLMAVSDPDSPKYGQFWTQDDVIEAFRPAADTSQAVRNWLSSHGIEHASESDNKQWLAFGLPAKDAEAMLKTEYFETVTPSGHVEVSCDSYSLPDDLREHVDFVKP
jgi:tripeptidyl-peptidase-1